MSESAAPALEFELSPEVPSLAEAAAPSAGILQAQEAAPAAAPEPPHEDATPAPETTEVSFVSEATPAPGVLGESASPPRAEVPAAG